MAKIPSVSNSYKYRDNSVFAAEKAEYTNTISSSAIEQRMQTSTNTTEPTHSGSSHMMGQWVYEPHRQNHFELQICGMEGLGTMEKFGRGSDGKARVVTSKYASTYLTLSLNNFTMPDLKVNKISIAYGNNKVHYAGVPDNTSEISITFNDFVGLSTESILCAWFNTVYDPITEKLNYSNKYKHDAYLIEYNVDGGFGGCWKLEGLWITSFKPGSYGQENGNTVRKLDCSFAYDRMYPYRLLDNNMVRTSDNGEVFGV